MDCETVIILPVVESWCYLGWRNWDLFSGDRVTTLESENRDLRERIECVTERTRTMLDRVRFLRQQTVNGSGA